MGYRSNIYVITDISNKALVAALKAADPDEVEEGIFKYWNATVPNTREREVMSFGFFDNKWYESYAEVGKIMSEINKLINEDKEDSFGYIEVGEDITDTTYKGSPWDFDMHLNRSVDMPYLDRKEEEE